MTRSQRHFLEYAPRTRCRRPSNFGFLAMSMAAVTICWLGYIQIGAVRYHAGGPLWKVLWTWSAAPGMTGIALGVIGLLQAGRRHALCAIAIAIIVLSYMFMMPPTNFA